MQTTGIPEELGPEAAARWLDGVGDTTVRQGDLWVLSWDGEVVGHALVAAAFAEGYVLAWPVTLAQEPSFSPGMVLSGSTLGVEVTLWPTLETGIGLHLLDRKLGSLMAPDEIRRIGRVMDEVTDLGYRENPRDGSSDEIERAMVEHWSGLCFNTGGLDGALFLDRAKVEAHGRDAAWVCETLHVEPSALVDVWWGKEPVPAEWLSAIADAVGVEGDELVRGEDLLSDVMVDLSRPAYKAEMRALVEATGLDEAQARRATRDAYTLAARDDSGSRERYEQKLRDAIARVRRQHGR